MGAAPASRTPAGVVYVDFCNAFDCNHAYLIERLGRSSINVNLSAWLESFLSGRRQPVRVGTCYSEGGMVSNEVPQASVLGPLLLNIL